MSIQVTAYTISVIVGAHVRTRTSDVLPLHVNILSLMYVDLPEHCGPHSKKSANVKLKKNQLIID